MLVARQLGGAVLYHEIEAIDFETGEVVIANSGENDLGWCLSGVRPRLIPNPWYRKDPVAGTCAWSELPAGPATLVGFTPHRDEPSGFRLPLLRRWTGRVRVASLGRIRRQPPQCSRSRTPGRPSGDCGPVPGHRLRSR